MHGFRASRSSSLWAGKGLAQDNLGRDRGSVGQMEQGQTWETLAPNPNLVSASRPPPQVFCSSPRKLGGSRALV